MPINAHDRIIMEISNDLLHGWLSLTRALTKLTEAQYAEDDPFLVSVKKLKDEATILSDSFDTEWRQAISQQRSSLFPRKDAP